MIYKTAEICDDLMGQSGRAIVAHPNHPFTRYTWFNSDPKFEKIFFSPRWKNKLSLSGIGNQFDPKSDLVVVPEIWVRKYGNQLIEKNIPFGIYVQNGYMIANGKFEELEYSYRNARVIITVSDDATECVRLAFPETAPRIHRLRLAINADKFKPAPIKENLITYMPRKLATHGKLIEFFLKNNLPSQWKIQVINGLPEDGVAEILSRSKIFISLSDMEGLGLPPIEAALAGNLVVGYTGEAGKEFWKKPLFTEIYHGDVRALAKQVRQLAEEMDSGALTEPVNERSALAKTFSLQSFTDDLEKMIKDFVLIK